MKSQNILIPLLFFPLFSLGAAVFTDRHHPPLNVGHHQVIYLDAPEQLQSQFFGELPVDPAEAGRVVKTRMQSQGWPRMQQQLMQAYQGVLKAYSLKLAKYPAVVSDDNHVVYGTADVAVAEQLLAEFRGGAVMRRFFSRSVLVLICIVPPVMAGSLNSLQIVQSALSLQCMEYKITGMCYWLFCTLYGCTVKTSVKVRHYIPDAVVSAYNQTSGNPWSEMALAGTGIAGLAEGGGANEQKRQGHKTNLRFKNTDVIGHPALASPLFNQFSGAMGMTCAGGGVPPEKTG